MDEENARKRPRGDSEMLGTDDASRTPPTTTNEDTGSVPNPEIGDGEKAEVTVVREGSLEVKVVTEGVQEVELEDKQPNSESPTDSDDQQEGGPVATEDSAEESTDTAVVTTDEALNLDSVKPEAIPLPEENSDESDELRSSSPSPLEQEEPTTNAAVEPTESQEEVNDDETPSVPDGPRLPRSTPRKLRPSSPKKIARV